VNILSIELEKSLNEIGKEKDNPIDTIRNKYGINLIKKGRSI